MMHSSKQITLQITTCNRIEALKITLARIHDILMDERVYIIFCVDGSTDDTYDYLTENFPQAEIIRNTKSIGLIASRNRMMALTQTPYALSLDDDLNILTSHSIDTLLHFFETHQDCAVQSFRIFWSTTPPVQTNHSEKVEMIAGFAGGAHAFRMKAWHQINPYPEWYRFYGEEEYASMQLFKAGWKIYYNPEVLGHHRVDINNRKRSVKDYFTRQKLSYRAGLYNIVCFFPLKTLPKIYAYSFLKQLRTKLFKGDMIATAGVICGLCSFLFNLYRLPRYANRFSHAEFEHYMKLKKVPLFWRPDSSTLSI